MLFRITAIVLLAGIAAETALAQGADSTGVVEGHVFYEADVELRPAYPHARVVVGNVPLYRWNGKEWEGGAIAAADPDSTGFFRMEAPAGRDTLSIISCYFDSSSRVVDIPAGDTTRVTLVAQPHRSFLAPRRDAPPDSVSAPHLLRGRDAAARALGLRPLRQTVLPEGSRELRLTVIGGYGTADNGSFIRILETAGKASIESIRFWPVNSDSVSARTWTEWHRFDEAPRCDEIRRGVMEGNPVGRAARVVPGADDSDDTRDFETRPIIPPREIEACKTRFDEDPDARALLASLDSLGVMTLPDGDSLPGGGCISLHGFWLVLETLDDDGYRFSQHSDLRSDHPFLEESRRAAGIAFQTMLLNTHLASPGGYGTFRGHIETSPHGASFFRCGSAEAWIAEDSGRLGFRDSTGTRLYIEGRGQLQPRGEFERYEGDADMRRHHPVLSPPSDRAAYREGIRVYPRRLYFRNPSVDDEDLLIREARPGDCDAPPSISWTEPIIPDEPE